MTDGWTLAIDIGTSNTAAAHATASGAIEALRLATTGNLMPSSVFVGSAEDIVVGATAINRARPEPARFIPSPKRLLSRSTDPVDIAGLSVPQPDLFAAIIRTVIDRGRERHDGEDPATVVLTHPEGWSQSQIDVLIDAAERAGVAPANVVTMSEPIAATRHYLRERPGAPEARIGVFDFGAGTLDVAIVEDNGERVVTTRGDTRLGGRTFDAAIRRWSREQMSVANPELVAALDHATPATRMRNDAAIQEAKELLSETPSATVEISDGRGESASLLLTRAEFDTLAAPIVDRAVELTRESIDSAGGTVDTLYLTGGSSRVPLVHQRLSDLAQIASLDDPKTVVARGAVAAAAQGTPITPESIEPIVPRLTDRPKPDGRKKWWLAAVVALTVVVAVTAGLLVRSRTSEGPEPREVSTSADRVGTTEDEVLGALPPQLAEAVDDCVESEFTENEGVRYRCGVPAENPVVAGLTAFGGPLELTVAVDVAEARRKVIQDRENAGLNNTSAGQEQLIENTARTAAATVGGGVTPSMFSYANNSTGVVASARLRDVAAARTFLTRSGLIT